MYYFFLWVFLLLVAKWNGWKGMLPAILYCSAGASRFIDGKEAGMSQFDFLWFMMFCGTVVYLIECDWDRLKKNNGGGCGGGCGSGGGCGGG